jgi:aldehyde dehydrogenase (NAD(P)+)
MLVLPKGWAQGRALVEAVAGWLGRVPPRKAYYPGAADRYRALTEGRAVTRIGDAGEGRLPWTLIEGLDPGSDDAAFTTEPFCGLLNVVELPESEPARFLDAAVAFANDRLWGTLNACLFVHPASEREAAVAAAVDRAIVNLRYGTVGINHWPALGYGFVSLPWGGHPSATLANVQSGLGWVHNTYLVEGIDKAVVRGPLKAFPTPAWFLGHRTTHVVGRKLVDFEAAPSWLKLPGLVAAAVRG